MVRRWFFLDKNGVCFDVTRNEKYRRFVLGFVEEISRVFTIAWSPLEVKVKDIFSNGLDKQTCCLLLLGIFFPKTKGSKRFRRTSDDFVNLFLTNWKVLTELLLTQQVEYWWFSRMWSWHSEARGVIQVLPPAR
jgi:hypothetical protein